MSMNKMMTKSMITKKNGDVMDHGLLIFKILRKDQDQQKIKTNKIIMKWP